MTIANECPSIYLGLCFRLDDTNSKVQDLKTTELKDLELFKVLSRPNICILYSYMYLELFIGPTSGFYQIADCHSGNINDKL